MRTDLSTRQVAILRKPKLGCVSKPQSRSKADGHRPLVFLAIVLLLILSLGLPTAPYVVANPSFTARDESYIYRASLTTPFDATVNKAVGVVEGDIMFCCIAAYKSGYNLAIDSVPSGWTLISSVTDRTGEEYWLYYKIAGASEPSSYTWSFDSDFRVLLVNSAYTSGDFDPADPIDTYSVVEYIVSDVYVRASMTVSAVNSPLVFWAMRTNASCTFTKPSVPTTDWVEDLDYNGGTYICTEVCSMVWTGLGATGNIDATASTSGTRKHGFAVALNPPPAPVPPTVVTIENPDVGKTWAYLCANVTDIGIGNVTHRGFEWGLAPGDYTWNWGEYGSWNETGEYCYNATAGITCSDTLYFRGFAANVDGYGYGDEESFNTTACDAPTVETNDATGISYTTATVHGNITVIDGPDATARGFEYDTDSADPPFTFDWHEDGAFGTGTFEHELSLLSDGQLYYFRAYATGIGGTGYGSALNFTTWAYEVPTVATFNATDIGLTYAFLSGNITYVDGLNVTLRGFEWDVDMGDPYANNWTESGNYTTGTFSYNATGLPVGGLIYFRAIAYNAEGWGYGAELNFTTMLPLPLAPTNFTATQTGTNEIVLNWTMGVYAATTIIRGSTENFPATITDGYEVYNGAGTNATLVGLSLTFETYYYSAWSENPTGLSLDNAETKIGGESMLLLIVFLLPMGFTGLYAWKREMWMGLVSSIGWVCLGVYFMLEVSVSPSLMDVTDIWMGLVWLCFVLAIVFAITSFAWKKSEIIWQEEEDDTGWGDPSMVMFKNGIRTNKQRDLTDLEVRDREQRVKAEQSRPAKRKSDYPRQVQIHKP